MMTFQQAVGATMDVATGFHQGLGALGIHKNKITVSDTRLLEGSIDIDVSTRKKYPNENRWDYAFSYKGEVFFMEVHSANSKEVKTVLKKLQWLKDWLNSQAPEIHKLKAKSCPAFYWVRSKGFAIPKTSPQYRAAKGAGLKPVSKINIQ